MKALLSTALLTLMTSTSFAANIDLDILQENHTKKDVTLVCTSNKSEATKLKLFVTRPNESLSLYYTTAEDGTFPVTVGYSNELCGQETGGSAAVGISENYYTTHNIVYGSDKNITTLSLGNIPFSKEGPQIILNQLIPGTFSLKKGTSITTKAALTVKVQCKFITSDNQVSQNFFNKCEPKAK